MRRRSEALLVCAPLLGAAIAQTPVQPRAAQAPATSARSDTIYVAVQSPPPTIIVEAPSQLPTIILSILGLGLVVFQLWIMRRQTRVMERQTAAMETQSTLLAKQTALSEQQDELRRNEAVFTFYRVAHDLAHELHKANRLPSTPIDANYETHPRQVLRDAGRLFAPLGSKFVLAISGVALWVDTYFEDVLAYNDGRLRGRNTEAWDAVQRDREQIGRNLDEAKLLIPSELRWMYHDGSDHPFRKLCMMPEALANEIMGGATEESEKLAGEHPGDEP